MVYPVSESLYSGKFADFEDQLRTKCNYRIRDLSLIIFLPFMESLNDAQLILEKNYCCHYTEAVVMVL